MRSSCRVELTVFFFSSGLILAGRAVLRVTIELSNEAELARGLGLEADISSDFFSSMMYLTNGLKELIGDSSVSESSILRIARLDIRGLR